MIQLAARLGTRDAVLLTIGSIVGTGIFLTTGDMARALPHGGWILATWAAAGLLTAMGASTYAELGGMYPHAGGIFHYLHAAWGRLPAFLWGWSCFWLIMSGGIAAIAMGFGEYARSFAPGIPAQAFALAAIAVLTVVNFFGVREAAWVQNAFAAVRIGSIAALVLFGLIAPAQSAGVSAAAPANLMAGLGLAMIPALWAYDGWYGLTASAGELRDPKRSLPLGMIAGVTAVVVLYLAVNVVYLRALPIGQLAGTRRVAEAAAAALFGAPASRWMAGAIVVAAFGCLSSTILYSSRSYLPMAEEGLFFRSLAAIHPRYRTPIVSLCAQSAWAAVLVVSGTYEQLYTWVTFASVLFHAATGAAVFRLRRSRPDAARPYRAWGYPIVPALFVAALIALALNTLAEKPKESVLGLLLIAAGLPAYLFWRRGGPRLPAVERGSDDRQVATMDNEKPMNEGEGNKTADKQYREGATRFARTPEAMEKAREAQLDVEQNPQEYQDAEAKGRAHGAGDLKDDLEGKVKKDD